MKLVSVSEMQAIENEANASGCTYEQMMENAGRGLAEIIQEEYGYLAEDGALGIVGSGNNGGDTLVALSYLAEQDWKAGAYIARPRPHDDPLLARLERAGGTVIWLDQDPKAKQLKELLRSHAILIDGILGTGISLPIKPDLAMLMKFIKREIQNIQPPPLVVAVDCPSGVDCNSGDAAEECLPADLTVTMAAIKRGLLAFPAYNLVGDLRLVGIGLPEDGEGLKAWREVKSHVADDVTVREIIPPRPLDAHKGTFGTALIVAGSTNYTGAALLAGEAAYRIGTGLVTLAIPAPLHATLAGRFPDATWILLPHDLGVIAEEAASLTLDSLERVTAMLVGPGIGLEDVTARFISHLFGYTSRPGKIGFMQVMSGDQSKLSDSALPPMVVDADGLKLLARLPNWSKLLPSHAVLTPHPGEMAILTGLTTSQIQENRLNTALNFSQEWQHVVVLKGAFTVVASPDGRSEVIPIATPALARAGTGDVLAGLIVGLRAQGIEAYEAAVAGAWIHAHAGELAAMRLGNTASVLASDVLDAAIEVISRLS